MALDRLHPAAWTERAYAHLVIGRMIAADLEPQDPSNCLLWALHQQAKEGGELILTPSRYGPWLHTQWKSRDGRRFEFAPADEKYRQVQPPTLYLGAMIEAPEGS